MNTPTTIELKTFETPGENKPFTCEVHGSHYIHGKKKIDRRFLDKALQHFAGLTVPGDFKNSRRHPGSFAEWVTKESGKLNSEELKAIDACFVAGILCGAFGVERETRGAHNRVFLTFPD